MILAIRTDAAQAELYLLDTKGSVQHYQQWLAGRELAANLLEHIEEFMSNNGLSFSDLVGIGVYSGTGSFTGLRIGTSVANALAYSLNIKVAKATGAEWLARVTAELKTTSVGSYVTPSYDRAANITKPGKSA